MPTRNPWHEIGQSKEVAHLLPESLTEAGFWFLLQAYRIGSTFRSYEWMAKFLTSSEWIVEDYAEYCQIEGAPFEKPAVKSASMSC